MNNFPKNFFLGVFFYLFTIVSTQAQTVKLNDVISCFNAPEYPVCLFEMLENKGFERIDKEYPGNCERIIYAYPATGKPKIFFNPTLCRKLYLSEMYPVKIKNELEIQFQKSSKPYFDKLSAEIRKTCKALPAENGSIPGSKSKTSTRAYRHQASGITFLIKNTSPVKYIYLLK
jgi:hypothetical protein